MYLFPFFVIFVVWFSYEMKKNSRKAAQKNDTYWEEERTANFTRKKDIGQLDYITIPLEILPFFEKTDDELEKYQAIIKRLSQKKILNLTGLSNTELKKKYGSANLPALTEYDGNFSLLVSTIAKWGERLMALGYTEEAITVLEFGIQCQSDVSTNYTLLAQYYTSSKNPQALDHLTATAQSLNSLMREPILNKLKAISQTPQ